MACNGEVFARCSPRIEHRQLFLGRLLREEFPLEYTLGESDTYDPGGNGLLRLVLLQAETSQCV